MAAENFIGVIKLKTEPICQRNYMRRDKVLRQITEVLATLAAAETLTRHATH